MLAQTHLKLANLPASAGRLASSEVSRLGGARRFAVRRHDEGLLEGRGATVHNTRTDDGMALKLDGQRLEESPALQGDGWARRRPGRRCTRRH